MISGQAPQKMMEGINKLIGKGVIQYIEHEKGEFISTIFFCSKSDRTRLILNLKTLNNEFLEYGLFKMKTAYSVADLIQPHCYMTSMDLKRGFYLVEIFEEDSKYLKLYAGIFFLKFVALPTGLSSGSRKFIKLTKPLIACLRIGRLMTLLSMEKLMKNVLLVLLKSLSYF